MPISCASLVLNVQAITGRPGDTELVTATRCFQWFNEAQYKISQYSHNIPNLQFKCLTSVTVGTDDMYVGLSEITMKSADHTHTSPMYIGNISLSDGSINTYDMRYVQVDDFDGFNSDVSSAATSSGRPTIWTQRGNNIELQPRPSSDYNGYFLRITGQRQTEFTAVDTTKFSEISNCEQGLTYYAVAEAFAAIGDENKAEIWRRKFSNPQAGGPADLGFLQNFGDQYARMDAWAGGMYEEIP
jgi:hypothetical protein